MPPPTSTLSSKNEWEWGRGDGYLSVFDLRKSALLARSDNMEDELLSVVMVKNGTKVLCGTQLGIVCFFNWGDWGDLKDRFVGHPSSIEAMAVIDQDTICTGASDGLVRICSILPNKMLGIVADHQGFPVERLTITGVDQHDRWLATCSHDEIVRIFDISFLYHQQQQQQQQEQGEEEGSDKEEVVKNNKRMLKPMKNPQKLRKKQELNEFFADL